MVDGEPASPKDLEKALSPLGERVARDGAFPRRAGRVRGSLGVAKKRNAEILRFAQNDTNMKVLT